MEVAAKPDNEAERLEATLSLGLLDTPPEERFDRYTRFAQRLLEVPIAYVSFIGDDIQWFKSVQGLEIEQVPREQSFCSHTILTEEMMIVEDTIEDSRFRNNPFVVNPPYVRFYAGVKLNIREGICVGTFCVADIKPRYPSEEDMQLLKDLAHLLELEFHTQSIATTDELTGLSNRHGFRLIANHSIALCRRMDKAATLIVFDLDGFRYINGKYGHAEGDKVLRDIGQILLTEFRDSDVIGRIGGDEFCVLLTGTSTDNIEIPLKNLERALHEENINLPYNISYTFGTVPLDPKRHQNIDDVLRDADTVMYQQKKAR